MHERSESHHRRTDASESRPDSPTAIPLPSEHAALWDQLQETLAADGPGDLQKLRRELEELPPGSWSEAVRSQLKRTGDETLIALAGRLGREWLASAPVDE